MCVLPYNAVHAWLMTSKHTVPDLEEREIDREIEIERERERERRERERERERERRMVETGGREGRGKTGMWLVGDRKCWL